MSVESPSDSSARGPAAGGSGSLELGALVGVETSFSAASATHDDGDGPAGGAGGDVDLAVVGAAVRPGTAYDPATAAARPAAPTTAVDGTSQGNGPGPGPGAGAGAGSSVDPDVAGASQEPAGRLGVEAGEADASPPAASPAPTTHNWSRPATATARSRPSRPESAMTEGTLGTGADVDVGMSVHSDGGEGEGEEEGEDAGTLQTGADVSVNVSPTGSPGALPSRPPTAGNTRPRQLLSPGSDHSLATGATVDVGLSVHSEGAEGAERDDGASLGTGEDVSVALSHNGGHEGGARASL